MISECQSAIIDPAIAIIPGLADQVMSRRMLERIATLASSCRAAQLPVVHCTVRLSPNAERFPVHSPLQAIMRRNPLLSSDREESYIHPIVMPLGMDYVCERHHGVHGFHDIKLEALLRSLHVQTIIIAGVSTNIAIPGMCIEAINRGFAVVIAEDCTAGQSLEVHDLILRFQLSILAKISQSSEIIDCLSERINSTRGRL